MLGLHHLLLVRPKSRVAVVPKNPFHFHLANHRMQIAAQRESDAIKMTLSKRADGLIRVVQQKTKLAFWVLKCAKWRLYIVVIFETGGAELNRLLGPIVPQIGATA
jgi:hypothetical protein